MKARYALLSLLSIVRKKDREPAEDDYQDSDSPFLWSDLAYPFNSTTAFIEKLHLLVFIVKQNFPCVMLKAIVAKLIYKFKLLIGMSSFLSLMLSLTGVSGL